MIPAFTFEFPTIIEFGVGKVSEIMKAVEREKADKVVLVTDPVLASIGMLDPIRKILEENGIAYTVYQDIRQNPLSSQVDACGKLCAEFGAISVVSIRSFFWLLSVMTIQSETSEPVPDVVGSAATGKNFSVGTFMSSPRMSM